MSEVPQYTSEQKLTGLAIAIPILISLFVMAFPAGFAFFIVAAITGDNYSLGGLVAAIVYAAGLILVPFFMIRHYKKKAVSFFDDHLIIGGKNESVPYSDIGDAHLTGGGKYIVLQRAFKGQFPQPPISFSPKKEPEIVFDNVVNLIKRARGDSFFTIRKREQVQYHGKFDYSLLGTQRIDKIEIKAGKLALKEDYILINAETSPNYAIISPYNRKKHNYYRHKVLVKGPVPETERCDGDGLLTIDHYLSKTEILPVGWEYFEITTKKGAYLGKFQLKKKFISPIDDFKITILNREITLHGDIADYHYKIQIAGREIGRLEIPIVRLKTYATITFTQPVDPVYALPLALAIDNLPSSHNNRTEFDRSYGPAIKTGIAIRKGIGPLLGRLVKSLK